MPYCGNSMDVSGLNPLIKPDQLARGKPAKARSLEFYDISLGVVRLNDPAISYGLVFACEGVLFLVAASLARHIHIANWVAGQQDPLPSFGDIALAEAGDGGIR